MPELPEVETIVRQLKPRISGKKIAKAVILRPQQWQNISAEDATNILAANTFHNIERRAKFIILTLDNDYRLIIHLRMSGKLLCADDWTAIDKYTRDIFCFTDGSSLQYNDTRALGTLEIVPPGEQPESFQKLGVEPLGQDFKKELLQQQLAKSRLEIKDFLMNQKNVVGIGNIYANEILFRCGIHPRRIANSLNLSEIERLHQTIPEVLKLAIERMGTTIGNSASDYRTVYNIEGDFQNLLQVYGRKGEPCFICKKPITRIVQKGRSSYICENCQK